MLVLIPSLHKADADPKAVPDQNVVVRLAHVFQANDQPFAVVTTNFLPNLRAILHHVGLTGVPQWNVFDAILGVTVTAGTPLQFNDLALPANVEPYPHGNTISVFKDEQVIMRVHTYGVMHIASIDTLQANGQVGQTATYDDRGFLTQRVSFAPDGKTPTTTTWFNERGQTVLTQDASGAVVIAASQRARFAQAEYPDMLTVVGEFMTQWLTKQATMPVGIARLDPAFMPVRQLLQGFPRILFLTEHGEATNWPLAQQLFPTDELVFPTTMDQQLFKTVADNDPAYSPALVAQAHVVNFYPTSLSLGDSNAMAELVTYWHVGDLPLQDAQDLTGKLVEMMQRDRDKVLVAETNDSDEAENLQGIAQAKVGELYGVDFASTEFTEIATYLTAKLGGKYIMNAEATGQALKNLPVWADYSAAFLLLQRLSIAGIGDVKPKDRAAAFMGARVVLDTNSLPGTQLQVDAISIGVPQLVRYDNEFVIAGKTGRVITDLSQIPAALHYYLDELHHWNAALVEDIDLIEANAPAQIMAKWKEVIANGQEETTTITGDPDLD